MNNKGDLLDTYATAYLFKSGSATPMPLPYGAFAFNDLDQIVGAKSGAFVVYKDGAVQQQLDFGSQFPYPYPTAINNSGQITGYEQFMLGNTSTSNAFFYSDGTTQNIPKHTQEESLFPVALNSRGEVAGLALKSRVDAVENESGFLYSHGLRMDIFPASASEVYVSGLDSSGRVSGYYSIKGSKETHVLVYSGGQLNDLGPGIGNNTTTSGMNDCGEIVGGDGSNSHGFIYTHGTFVQLEDLVSAPPDDLLRPLAINNRGQIFGYLFNTHHGGDGTFLMTPTVFEKCGSDATISNSPDLTTSSLGGNITYTITAKNLDTAASDFTVTDALDPTTSLVSCSVAGSGGTCTGAPGGHSISVALPNLAKHSSATITVKVAGSQTAPAQNVIMNTAKLSSSMTADYLSTAYTSIQWRETVRSSPPFAKPPLLVLSLPWPTAFAKTE